MKCGVFAHGFTRVSESRGNGLADGRAQSVLVTHVSE